MKQSHGETQQRGYVMTNFNPNDYTAPWGRTTTVPSSVAWPTGDSLSQPSPFGWSNQGYTPTSYTPQTFTWNTSGNFFNNNTFVQSNPSWGPTNNDWSDSTSWNSSANWTESNLWNWTTPTPNQSGASSPSQGWYSSTFEWSPTNVTPGEFDGSPVPGFDFDAPWINPDIDWGDYFQPEDLPENNPQPNETTPQNTDVKIIPQSQIPPAEVLPPALPQPPTQPAPPAEPTPPTVPTPSEVPPPGLPGADGGTLPDLDPVVDPGLIADDTLLPPLENPPTLIPPAVVNRPTFEQANIIDIADVPITGVTLNGDNLNNRLEGTENNDFLNGNLGNDILIGGNGDDIYVVDNKNDTITETADGGNDIVQASSTFTLPNHVENLFLITDNYEKVILPDGTEAVLYGDPFEWIESGRLDYQQGVTIDGEEYLGTCGLASISNLLNLSGVRITEDEVVRFCVENNLCITGVDPLINGGTNFEYISAILENYGVSTYYAQYSSNEIANYILNGYGVLVSVDADVLWYDESPDIYNHEITVTGVVYNLDQTELLGFYICDSGFRSVEYGQKYLDVETFERMYLDADGAATISSVPIRQETGPIEGYGNALNNIIVGNQFDNILYGLDGDDGLEGAGGNDALYGGNGNDAYLYMSRSFGEDIIFDQSGTNDRINVSELYNSSEATFEAIDYDGNGNLDSLLITFANSKITVVDQFTDTTADIDSLNLGNGAIEVILFSDDTFTTFDIFQALG